MSDTASECRSLTPEERRLVTWMLEHGGPEARSFMCQLELATVSAWKCPCGCASFDLMIAGLDPPPAESNMRVLADSVYGDDDGFGIYCFERGGILSGIEVCGFAADAPSVLPLPEVLRPLCTSAVKPGLDDTQ